MSVAAEELRKLSEPFDEGDIEWRVAQAGIKNGLPWCQVMCYITARAIQFRLDDVCGPENWRNEPPEMKEVRPGIVAIVCGISIRLKDGWLTKYDVAEPTNIEPAKGGFSGAMKRAGAQWGIGRYLYHLEAAFAETSDQRADGYQYARLPKDKGGDVYYWKPPQLPSWALPKEPDSDVSAQSLQELKSLWRAKFAPDNKNPSELREGFRLYVQALVGKFPSDDHTCWTADAYAKVQAKIEETVDGDSIDPDIPFEE